MNEQAEMSRGRPTHSVLPATGDPIASEEPSLGKTRKPTYKELEEQFFQLREEVAHLKSRIRHREQASKEEDGGVRIECFVKNGEELQEFAERYFKHYIDPFWYDDHEGVKYCGLSPSADLVATIAKHGISPEIVQVEPTVLLDFDLSTRSIIFPINIQVSKATEDMLYILENEPKKHPFSETHTPGTRWDFLSGA